MHLNSFLKIKFLINKKSKAQHVVELAMMMPLFIILFSYTFQLMVETYSKYRFSYIFTNSLRNVINNPVIYDNLTNAADYNIEKLVQTELDRELSKSGKIPFTNVLVEAINSNETTFFRGAYQLVADRIFFGQTGKEYFYFTIPINKTHTTPIVLNKTTFDVESYFNFYFKYYSEKYFEADDTSSGGTGSGETTEGGGEGGETTEGGEGDNSGNSGTQEENSSDNNSGDEGISGALEVQ